MLADKLDRYKRKNNKYMDDNIKEIQEIYMEEEQEKRETIENEEVILIWPYEVSLSTTSTSLTSSISFISNEVENLTKYIKFVKSPLQTRIF